MKRLFLAVLISMLALSVLVIPAFASSVGNVDIEVTTETPDVHPGDPITFVFTLKNTDGKVVSGITLDVVLPSGIVQDGNAVLECKSLYNLSDPGFSGNTLNVTNIDGSGPTTDIKLLTLPCKVEDNANVSSPYSVTVSISEITSGGNTLQGTPKPAIVNVTHTEDQHVWDNVWKDDPEQTADCVNAGREYQACTAGGCQERKYQSKAALGHDFDDSNPTATFTWSEPDGKTIPTATYKVHCSRRGCQYNAGEGYELTAEVTEVNKTAPKCETEGKTDYKAVAEVTDSEGTKTYTDATSKTNVTLVATGHEWSDMTVVWGEPDDGSAKPSKATATATCAHGENCEYKTETVVVEQAQIQESGKNPTCTQPGNKIYTANFVFTHGATSGKKSLVIDTIPAHGHDWDVQNIEWTWNPTSSADVNNAKAVVKCKNDDCDGGESGESGYYTVGLSMNVTVTQNEEGITPAKCETDGKATYTATASHSDVNGGQEYTTERSDVTLPKLGHDWQEPVFVWDETPGKYTATVTRICANGANCDLTEGKPQEPMADSLKVTSLVETEPSYAAEGKTVWTATAKFQKDKSDSTGEEKSAAKIETVAKLIPVSTADVQAPAGVTAGIEDAGLKAEADALVQQALTAESAPAGMPKEVFEAIKTASASTDAENEPLEVTTELVVEQPAAVPTVTGVDAASVAGAYEIYIKMTVEGKGLTDAVTGYITETADLISFTVPVPEKGGPIFYMMTDHGGTWKKIDSKVEGKNIVFSSKEFSNFVIIGSNNIADADITVTPEYAYTGSAVSPVVKVTINGGAVELKEGVDYELSVTGDAVQPGEYKVTIKGIGSYTGSVEKTFTVLKPNETPTPAPTAKPTAAPAATKDPNAAPATGDETPVVLYVTVLTVCAAALALVLVFRRRREK